MTLPMMCATESTRSSPLPQSRMTRLRDELRALAEQGDLTSAMIRYQQRNEELEYSDRRAVFGRYGRRR
jgi:hypothetical protein